MNKTVLRFLVFFVLFVALGGVYERTWHKPVSPYFTRSYAVVSGLAIRLLSPKEALSVQDSVLSSGGQPIIEVTRECDGVSSFLLIAAAVLAMSAPLARKLLGLGLGFLLVGVCNVVRITALYYVFKYFPDIAEKVHVFIGPLVVMLPLLAFFLYWSRPPLSVHARTA